MPATLNNYRASIGNNAVRYETFEGRQHLVVPVVMIVEGVLPGSAGPRFIPSAEFSKYPESWNGRPVPVLHPEKNGQPISANQPDVIERNSIGQLFNTHVDGPKLKSEAWIDIEKAKRLGHAGLVDALAAGEVVEVSTGFFSDDAPTRGSFNGAEYEGVTRNIRPDHLALLPGEIGACSVADGCGTRVNSRKTTMSDRMKDAFQTLARGLGFRVNCECDDEGDSPMTKPKTHADQVKANKAEIEKDQKAFVEKMTANAKLDAEQIQSLLEMDPDQLAQLGALAGVLAEGAAAPEGDPEEMEEAGGGAPMDDEPMDVSKVVANGKFDQKRFDELVNNRVDEQIRRREVTSKLASYGNCPFEESEMAGMSVNHLEKLEKSLRPVDYSGQGGFGINGAAEDSQPLTLNKGVLRGKKTADKEQ